VKFWKEDADVKRRGKERLDYFGNEADVANSIVEGALRARKATRLLLHWGKSANATAMSATQPPWLKKGRVMGMTGLQGVRNWRLRRSSAALQILWGSRGLVLQMGRLQ